MNKFLLMLGLCKRAGKVQIGTPQVVEVVQKRTAKAVFYACDASANTRKRITDKCAFYGVECIEVEYSSQELSHALGKSGSVCAVGIMDEGFLKQLMGLLNKN